MAIHPLCDSFEISGEWHLPDRSEIKIPGYLHYSPERTELHLNDPFQPLQGAIRAGDAPVPYQVIYGTTTKGDAMTLLRAQRMGISLHIGSGGMRQPERLISSWLLIGAHIPPDFAYPEVSFRIPGLQIWLSKRIIEESSFRDNETGRITYTYNILQVDNDTTPVPAIDATLDWAVSWNSTADPFSSIAVGVSAWVTIKPSKPQLLEWYFEQESKLAAFLAFLAGTPMSPDCIEASIGDPHHKISVMVAMRDSHYCCYKNLYDFFMPRGAMGVDFSSVVARWFEIYPQVHMPSQLALSVLATRKLWLHVEFLSLMQALEGFHRGLLDGNYMQDKDYERVKKSLGDAIPSDVASDHKDALRSRIRYGNQISLRKRLDALADLLTQPLREIVIGGNGKVPRNWIDTRNYYTHWDEELRSNVLDGQSMYYANVRMRLLVRILYLDLMGIPEASIIRSLSGANEISQHVVQLNFADRRLNNPNDTSGIVMTIAVGSREDITGHEIDSAGFKEVSGNATAEANLQP